MTICHFSRYIRETRDQFLFLFTEIFREENLQSSFRVWEFKRQRDMALPKAKEIVSSNPVVVFRFLFVYQTVSFFDLMITYLYMYRRWCRGLWPQQDVLSVLREREAAVDSIGSEFQGYWVGHWKWEILFFLIYLFMWFCLELEFQSSIVLYICGIEVEFNFFEAAARILNSNGNWLGIKSNSLYVEGLVELRLCIYLIQRL